MEPPKQEFTAYLRHGNGQVVALPTDELLAALACVQAGSRTQEHWSSTNTGAVRAFLQTLKAVMQTCKTL
jgi:hypothetical protein